MKSIPCNLCNSRDHKIIYPSTIRPSDNIEISGTCTDTGHGTHYRIIQCTQCGLYYCSPRPEEKEIIKAYAHAEDPLYQKELPGRKKTFLRNIKKINRNTKVIVVSRLADMEIIKEAKNLGIVAYLTKPVLLSELMEIVLKNIGAEPRFFELKRVSKNV